MVPWVGRQSVIVAFPVHTHFYMLIGFGSKLNRQIVGIAMGTNCAPFVADLFLLCYEIREASEYK